MPDSATSPNPAALIEAARKAAAYAYAPYSGFHVGAALLLADGRVITGANVENASYGLTLCAETVALAKAANDGNLADVVAVAVIGGRPDESGALSGDAPVTPCGRCRQMLNEAAQLGQRDLPIHCSAGDGTNHVTHALSSLLPHAFGPANL